MGSQASIVYMGTPDFAVPALTALHTASFAVRLAITQPDQPKGRGRRLTPHPVKIAAQKLGIDVFQPPKVREPEAIALLRELAPDFIVVVAYGQILPRSILQIPKYGAINLHASLLPKFRGPAPIQWALMRGETETGVTTMLMDHGVDTGDILLSRKYPIAPNDTADTLHENMARIGADLLVETLRLRGQGLILPTIQDHTRATYAPMLKKQDGRIKWQLSAQELDAFIRAMASWPGAFCFLGEKRLKIFKACPVSTSMDADAGLAVPGFPDELLVATGRGVLSILEIQGASGKAMAIRDFLRGHPISPGAMFT